MFDKAKKALESKEAAIKGKEWLEEVQDSQGNWKDVEGWSETYEPKKEKKEKSEFAKKQEAKIQAEAMQVAIAKINDGLSKKMLQVLLETSAFILGKATSNEAALPPIKDPILPKLLDSLKAILLSYRFEKKKEARKFEFFRLQACDDITTILKPYLDNAPEKNFQNMTTEFKMIMKEQKVFVRQKLLKTIDDIIFLADTKADEKIDDVEAKVEQLKGATEMAMSTAKQVGLPGQEQADKIVSEAKGVADSVLPSDTEKSGAKMMKNDMVNQFADMIKGMLLTKMEDLDEVLSEYLEKFLQAVEMIVKVQGTAMKGKGKSQTDLKDEMNKTVGELYDEANIRIKAEVENLSDLLLTMIKQKMPEDEA